MKTNISIFTFAIILCFSVAKISAQPKLWGSLPRGCNTESGLIYEIGLDGSNYNSIKEFDYPNCHSLRGQVLYASNGMVYSIGEGGFATFNSVIWEYNPETGSFAFIHDFFNTETGQENYAGLCSLMEHSNGKVYGLTLYGGTNHDGQLFELDLQTKEITIKVEFEFDSKGKAPVGKLIEASDGRLYGIARQGGMHSFGLLYVYDPGTNVFAVLKHFNGAGNGAEPNNGPIQADNGKLYGMTRLGGTSDLGVVYEYDIASNVITKKHDFDGTATGSWPENQFFQASDGMLYAMTTAGGNSDNGTIIQYDINTGVLTKKMNFNGTYGRFPTGRFIEYSDGMMYAMTPYGGLEDKGVLFKFDPVSASYTKLHEFYAEYGEVTYGSLTLGPEGKLFGVTWEGGLFNKGVLFDYTPSSGLYAKRIDFMYTSDGGTPHCSLIEASDGMVYGTTYGGGENGAGTIFRIDPTNRLFEKLFDFETINLGGGCLDGLTEASNGLLYGFATRGGANSDGVLFAFDPSISLYTVVFNFDQAVSGYFPMGKPVEGLNNKLYGVAESGGINGNGVLFEYNLATSTFVKLHDFNQIPSGKYPCGVMQASNGKLYGMTRYGGTYDKGVLFEYDLSTNALTVKVHFDNINKGAIPIGTLLEFEDNQLYGITTNGGSFSSGVLFHFDATNGQFTKLMNFAFDGNGYSPFCSLMKASNDKIYGTTRLGGQYNNGVVFSYEPNGAFYNVVYDFQEYGDQPLYSKLLEVDSDYGVDEISDKSLDFSLYPNPVRDKLTISFPKFQENFQLRIFDMKGRVLFNEYQSLNPSGSATSTYTIPDLDNGIYTVQILSEQGNGVQKFIVNK